MVGVTGLGRFREMLGLVSGFFRRAYKEMTVTRIVWIFVLGCVMGFFAETGYWLLMRGALESRKGLIYGPFSQIYGFGAVVMTLVLTLFAELGRPWVFVGGVAVGGLYEALSGIIQEKLFGSVSWSYAAKPFSFIGGRTCLKQMIFWGVMSLVYMVAIYPRVSKAIDRVPRLLKRALTWGFGLFLVVDMALSAMAVDRWSDRVSGLPAQSGLEMWLDNRYPDGRLAEIYPNMRFVKEAARGRD